MEDKKSIHAVLWALGLAVIAWLLFRPKRQIITTGGTAVEPASALMIPAAGTSPDYLTYNVPAAAKAGLYAGGQIKPIALTGSAGGSQGSSGGGSCGCGCASSNSLNSKLVPSMDALASAYTSQVDGLESKYLANIISAFPSMQQTGQAVTTTPERSGTVYSNIPQA